MGCILASKSVEDVDREKRKKNPPDLVPLLAVLALS